MYIYIHSKIITSLVETEEKVPLLSESMAKSSSAGCSIYRHIYSLNGYKLTQFHEGQRNFSVHSDLEKAFLGESICSINHSLAQKMKNTIRNSSG